MNHSRLPQNRQELGERDEPDNVETERQAAASKQPDKDAGGQHGTSQHRDAGGLQADLGTNATD